MQTLLTLDNEYFHQPLDTSRRDSYTIGHAARAVVADEKSRIALIYSQAYDYFKLPGCGIEKSEDVEQTLAREVGEEIAATIEITGEIGRTIEWRDHVSRKQISDGFLAQVREHHDNAVDPGMLEGFEIFWAPSLADAITFVDAGLASDDINVRFTAARDAAILRAAAES